jgi:hypothetical protein
MKAGTVIPRAIKNTPAIALAGTRAELERFPKSHPMLLTWRASIEGGIGPVSLLKPEGFGPGQEGSLFSGSWRLLHFVDVAAMRTAYGGLIIAGGQSQAGAAIFTGNGFVVIHTPHQV